MTTRVPARQSLGDLALTLFDELLPGPTWRAWRAFVVALFGAPATSEEADVIRACTGRTSLPVKAAREVFVIVGRRGGKSVLQALLAVFFAAVKPHRLRRGERGVVLVLAADRRQARVVFGYVLAFLKQLPVLSSMILRETTSEIDLTNGVSIEIATVSYRTVRGYTIVACICDEVAFWPTDEAAEPDTEVLNAVRPAMATTAGVLVCVSSPYAARGELHRAYQRHYGRNDSDVLVWQAATRVMNPTIDQGIVDRALAEDAAAASAEWLAQFRTDLETLFARDALAAVAASGRRELPPAPGVAYFAFVDPSGGSADSFTLAIAHRTPAGVPVLDLVREVHPPFSPEAVVTQFVADLARYSVSTVTGDAYAGEWPREQFRKLKVAYEVAPLTRSELFLELLPLVNAGTVELLDHARLLGQLGTLERRVGRLGKDSIDHRAGSHDDVANAAAGALVLALRSTGRAVWPATFTECLIHTPERPVACCLMGGTYEPDDPHCRRHCTGLAVAWPAYLRHQREGGRLRFSDFVESTFQPNAATSQWAWQHWGRRAAAVRLGF